MWVPKCKQDVVELLHDCQTGLVSCGFAAEVLFPEFARSDMSNNRWEQILDIRKDEYNAVFNT